jgi:SAM-dependent methyltransferase
MSWRVDREEWVEAATGTPTREPLRSVLDEVDGRLAGLLGFDLAPPPPGAVSDEVPTIHSGEILGTSAPVSTADEPRTGDEQLDVEVSAVGSAGPVGEALRVELEPGDAEAVREVEAAPAEAAPAEAAPESPPSTFADDDDEGVLVRPGVPAAVEAPPSGRVETMEADPAPEPAPEPAPDPVPEPAPEPEPEPGPEAQAEVEAQAEAAVADGPPPTESSPSLFMPASLLRPPEEPAVEEEVAVEEVPEEEPGAIAEAEPTDVEEVEAVPDQVERLRTEELEAEEVEEAEMLDAADLVEDASAQPPEPPPAHAAAPSAGPPKPPPPRRRNWYDDVFTEHYATLSPDGVEESAVRDVEFVASIAEVAQDATVLDVGCGIGYHALHLAELGYRVTGVDFSLAQLLRASELNEDRQGGVSFLHGDMRGLPTDEEFDLVMCLGSTLGYFEEDANRQSLEEMRDRVKPGGRMVLQVFNRDYLVSKLPIRSWWQGHKCLVLDEAELNYKANRLRVHRTIVFEDGRQFEHYMFMRAYSVHDLGKMLSSLGLKVISLSGSRETRGRFYGSASPDIWIVAERRVKE